MTGMTFPALLQRFFTDRLCTQMEASRHTIAGYRDTFRLLVRFVAARSGKPPTCLGIADLDAEVIGHFLIHIEMARGNGARSRNTRLAAVRSFFRYVAMNRSEEHTSELQSLMRISYAVFCLKKKQTVNHVL